MEALHGAPACTCDPLEKIPWEILKEMREVAIYTAWWKANLKAGYDDYKQDLVKIEEHFKAFKDFGLPKPEVCDMFKEMAELCATATTEERSGDQKVSDKAKADSFAKMNEMVKSQEISEGLAKDLWELCWYSGWHAANSRKIFHGSHAKRDAEKVQELYEKIGDDCRLVAFNFFGDAAKLINPKTPKYCAVQKLENKSDCDQEMCASFSHYNTVTHKWSTTAKWKVSVTGAIAGLYFIAGGIAASFSYSKSETKGVDITDGETKTYTFPVKIGPHCKVTAKGIVQEATAEVPYFMIFDIGGKRYCKDGVWTGILAGNVEYEIGESEPLD